MKKRTLAFLFLLLLVQACGGQSNRMTDPTPTQTKIIRLEGDMAFGNI